MAFNPDEYLKNKGPSDFNPDEYLNKKFEGASQEKTFLHSFENPIAKTGVGIIDALSRFVTGKSQEQVEKPYTDWKEPAKDFFKISPYLITPEGSIPMQMAKRFATSGLAGMGSGLLENKGFKKSALQGVEKGVEDAAVQGVIPPAIKGAGKYIAKKMPALVKGASKVGSFISSAHAENYENVLAKEVEQNSILNGPNKETGVFENTAKQARDLFEKLTNKVESDQGRLASINKTRNESASMKAIDTYNTLKENLGKTVGAARRGLDKNIENRANPDEAISYIDSILGSNKIPDPLHKESRLSGQEASVLKDLRNRLIPKSEYDNELKKVLASIPENEFNDPRLRYKIAEQLMAKKNLSKEPIPISSPVLDNIISDIQSKKNYYGKFNIHEDNPKLEGLLGEIEHRLHPVLNELEPDFANTKQNYANLKTIQDVLGTRFKSPKSMGRIISDYPSKLTELENVALENLQKGGQSDFLKKGVPIPKTKGMQKNEDLASFFRGTLSYPKSSINLMKRYRAEPEEMQAALQTLFGKNKQPLQAVENQLDSEPFYKIFPGQGGGSGSSEGFQNLVRSRLTALTRGAALPITSPSVHRMGIKAIGKTVKNAPAIASFVNRLAVPSVVSMDDGTLIPTMYDQFLKKKEYAK